VADGIGVARSRGRLQEVRADGTVWKGGIVLNAKGIGIRVYIFSQRAMWKEEPLVILPLLKLCFAHCDMNADSTYYKNNLRCVSSVQLIVESPTKSYPAKR
jgi:hypothetical protein